MSKELKRNSKEFSVNLASQIIEVLNQKNLEEMLRTLTFFVKDATGAKEVCLYIYEKEHKQLRMMSSSNNSEMESSKLKLQDLPGNLSISFNLGEKTAIPFYFENELVGIATIDSGEVPGKDMLSLISGVLKLCLELEDKEETIYKLSTLEKLDSMLNSMPMDYDTLYNSVLNFVVKILNAEKGAVWLVGEKELVVSYTSEISDEEILKHRVGFDHGMIGWIAKNTSPLLSTRVKIDPRASKDVFRFKIKSAIGVPVMDGGKLIAVMMLFNRKNTDFYRTYRHFDEFDLSILMSVINRMRLSMNQISLYLKLEHENKKLKKFQRQSEEYIIHQREQVRLLNSLQKIMKAMRSSQDIRNVYRIVLVGLTSGMGFGFNRALLLEKNESDKVLEAKEWIGPVSENNVATSWKTAKEREDMYADFSQYLRAEAMALQSSGGLNDFVRGRTFSYTGDYIFDRVINRGKIVHVTRILAKERERELMNLLNFLKVDEFVCVPLVGRREVYGAIILDNKYTSKPVDDDMIEMLRIFSESVGLTIESLKNFSELKEKTSNLEKQKVFVEYLRDFSQNVLENLDVAIVVVNREKQILEWNRKSEELFKFKKEKVINSAINILGPEFYDIFNVGEKVYAVKETITLNDYKFFFHGKEMFLNVKFSPLLEKETLRIVGYIAMFDDVTKEHMLEVELRTQERLAILGEMSARVAHEIRNPLSAIGGFAQRAKKIADGEKIAKYLDIILNETRRLEGIVNQTLDFSRSNLNVKFESESINEVVMDAVELYSDKFEVKSVELKLDLTKENDVAMVEPNHFKEVVINLIQNAIEACNKGGKMKISTYVRDENIHVEVWNNGIPIPPDKLEKIFQPFYTTKTHGTGLGLSICKKIIEEEHDGKIKAVSDKNGTSFIVTIPKKL